jgi:uncharacterized protein (TIGR02594 family)
VQITAFGLAQRFVGLREIQGPMSNAHVLAMLRLDSTWVTDDAVPWCSAFLNYIAWLLRVPRSKSLAARSWLKVGTPIPVRAARSDWDVVVLARGDGEQPGPDVFDAPGHVGFFAGLEPGQVLVLGGNQGDEVSVAPFPLGRVLGVRRLYEEV